MENLREKAQQQVSSNFKYFCDNFDELYNKYKDKYLVLKDKEVVADYITYDEAHKKAMEEYGSGCFSIQFCNKETMNGISFINYNISFGEVAI